MKISYRSHPIIEKLETGVLGELSITGVDRDALFKEFGNSNGKATRRIDFLKFLWSENVAAFRENIRIISNPFIDAFFSAKEKLRTSDLIEELLSGTHCGTFIQRENVNCYIIDDIEISGQRKHAVTLFIFKEFTKDKLMLMFAGTIVSGQKVEPVFVSSLIKEIGVQEYAEQCLELNVLLLNFIKYADVETKILNPNQRIKGVDCKYVNETDSKIEFLDCKWFTTLVKSDAFKVRGHFAIRACGEGRKDRKLSWIPEYQKNGYTASARKLNQQP